MTGVAPEATFKPIEGLEVSQVPDGYVIYRSATERVHYLNQTAVLVYELCAEGKRVEEIVAFIQDAYDLREAPVQSVADCILSLVKEGVLQPWPSSSGP